MNNYSIKLNESIDNDLFNILVLVVYGIIYLIIKLIEEVTK